MNRFLKNKKEKAKEAKGAKEAREAKAVDEMENDFSLAGMKSFKKSKKPEPEQKPELDFSTALPSNDDFRTSLLMPKLSARFSMLKEQDNPDSVLGKASDDSVLFPKRASKLNVFGHNPSLLSDIDEVSSTHSRPSFAMGRADSYASAGDGYGTDDDRSQDGSIMNRRRPIEGNNLFGGRQKVYKIPMKSDGASPNSETGRTMGGRAVYEEDIALSPFQRLRMKEKEDRAAEAGVSDTPAPESDDAMSRMSSAHRTTYSSTASGPANGRASTAATSVDEPFPHSQSQTSGIGDTHAGKSPSTGVAAERGSVRSRRLYGQGLAQSAQNQQASTLHRLESLSRQRAGTPELPHLTRNYSRSAANLRDRLQKLAIAEPSSKSRPTSPPSSATSPKRPNMETDHTEPRPQPNQSGGSLPPLTPPISENEEGTTLAAALQPEDRGKATAMGLFNKPVARFDEQQFTRRQLQMHEGRNTPPLTQRPSERAPQKSDDRPRDFSNGSYRSTAESVPSQYTGPPHTENSAAPSVDASPTKPGATFFTDSRSSESGDETDLRHSGDASSFSSQAMDGVHPALRSHTPSKPSTPRESQNAIPEVRYSDLSDLKPIEENDAVEDVNTSSGDAAFPEKPDSPTLGPTGLGLSGLVRTHLRRDSDRFSMHPPQPLDESETTAGAIGRPPADNTQSRIALPTPLLEEQPESTPSVSDDNADQIEARVQDELRANHHRNGSTETQKEREEFANELAERRRKVQEKLKSFAETESRAGSPVPGSRSQTPDLQGKTGNAFAMLKNRPGKQPSGNVFGLGNASTPALASDADDPERVPYSFGKHSNASSPHVSTDRPMRSRMPPTNIGSQEGSRESSRSRGPSPHSVFRPLRDRSGSETSGRSKSRGRYRDRDELGPLEEGAVASHGTSAFPEYSEPRNPPSVPSSVPSSARPSLEVSDRMPYERSMSAAGRYRSTSRSGPSSYDAPVHPPHPLQPQDPMVGASPRPSPAAPYSANATPPLSGLPRQQSQGLPPSHAPPAHGLPQRAPGHVGPQKKPINKYQISEPTFISCTSNVPTVGLPPGASLNNGYEAPPVPPMNPRRRRQTAAQTLRGALKGDRPELHHPTLTEDQRSFSDGVETAQRPRNRLRKSSSEGGQMNASARQEIMDDPSPPVPQHQYSQTMSMEGGMI